MYLQELLEVGVGLVFVWIGLALVIMGVQEWIASALKLRARDMEKTIRRMLEEPPPEGRKVYERVADWFVDTFLGWWASIERWWHGKADDSLVGMLYNHPLIKSLTKNPKGKPDYISASTFALALFDVVTTAGTEASVIQGALQALPEVVEQTAEEALEALLRTARDVITDEKALRDLKKALQVPEEMDDALRKLIEMVQSAGASKAKLAVLEEGGRSLKAAQKTLTTLKALLGKAQEVVAAERTRGCEEKDLAELKKGFDDFKRGHPNLVPILEKLEQATQTGLAMTAGTEVSVIEVALKGLLELVGQADPAKGALEALLKMAQDAGIEELKKGLEEFKKKYPQFQNQLEALLQVARTTPLGDETLEQLTKSAAKLALCNSTVKKAVDSLIADIEVKAGAVESALARARTNTETWFNETMATLSGWYKRRAQIIGIIIGVVVAVVFNVDSVVIANTLWREPTLRQAVVAQAEKYELPFESEEGSEAGGTGQGGGVKVAEPMTGTQNVDLSKTVDAFKKQFEGLQLPVGWMTATLTTTPTRQCVWPWSPPPAESSEDVVGFPLFGQCWVPVDASKEGPPVVVGHGDYWLPKVVGWLISGAAASFGAPFWFDVLKKLTNVRLAGKNPAEEEKEGKKS
jgi:hypothetical protein